MDESNFGRTNMPLSFWDVHSFNNEQKRPNQTNSYLVVLLEFGKWEINGPKTRINSYKVFILPARAAVPKERLFRGRREEESSNFPIENTRGMHADDNHRPEMPIGMNVCER